jgi:hypothetical protein
MHETSAIYNNSSLDAPFFKEIADQYDAVNFHFCNTSCSARADVPKNTSLYLPGCKKMINFAM